MKIPFLFAMTVAVLLPATASACRCAEQTLAEYFDRADLVVIGKLKHSEVQDSERTLTFELLAPAYKGERRLAQGGEVSVVTAVSSAACAVQPVQDAIFIVFAHRDGEVLRSDSCNGTRVHLPADGSEPSGFADVPPRFVAQQLNGLAGLEIMRMVSANQPNQDDAENDRMVGLLVHKQLAAGKSTAVFAKPSDDADPILVVDSFDAIESREYDYELPAAVVFTVLPGWFRVRLSDGQYAWIAEDEHTVLLGYPDIVVRRLNYLTEHWSGFVWPEMGAGLPVRDLRASGEGRREIPVEVHEVKYLAGMPFLRVSVLNRNMCSGGEPVAARFSGWIPAFGSDGRETAWFWSRGC